MRTDPTRYHTCSPAEIVARHENVPSNFPRKTLGQRQAAPRFHDAEDWNELTAVYLRQYDLPSWDAPCEPEVMGRWLDRLDMTATDYMQQTNTNLSDFCALNPEWPLRAWLGTVLELVHERRGA